MANRAAADDAYALEGSAFIAGAAVQWLRDGLGIIKTAAEVEALAREVPSSEGVTFVPALSGLGAPYWDQDARGHDRRTDARHHASPPRARHARGHRASVYDLLAAMANDAGRDLKQLRVDGGAARNDLLMQFQADVAGARIERPFDVESTGRGAAMLAGVGLGLFTVESAKSLLKINRSFEPAMAEPERAAHLARWQDAIRRTRTS